jgi:hypothetical protein
MMVAVLTIGLAAPHAAASTRTWRWNECRFQYKDGHRGWSVKESELTIRCVAGKFGVSTSTALYVADRESGFHATARNRSSGACGLFQHIPTYFPGRLRAVSTAKPAYRSFGPSCYNGRSNTYAALWMAKLHGWGAWGM